MQPVRWPDVLAVHTDAPYHQSAATQLHTCAQLMCCQRHGLTCLPAALCDDSLLACKLAGQQECAPSDLSPLAVPIADCNLYGNCTLAVYTGFSGADKHGTTLSTSTQIHQINQFSATTLYYKIKNNVRTALRCPTVFCCPLPPIPAGHKPACWQMWCNGMTVKVAAGEQYLGRCPVGHAGCIIKYSIQLDWRCCLRICM